MSADVAQQIEVLDRLRAATSSHHARLEALLDLTGPLSLDRYLRVLDGFHQFVPAWDARLTAALPPRLAAWLAPRLRGHLVGIDLAALGVSATPQPAPEVDALSIDSLPKAFGSLYVMEGSTLGGQVISRHLTTSLGLSADHGAAYFHGHGRLTGPMWKAFLATLRSEVTHDTDIDAAARSAADTFDALAQVFERCHARQPA